MDHAWSSYGARERELLEVYTLLGFLAGHTERVELFTLVTGLTCRRPGRLAKLVSAVGVAVGRAGLARFRSRFANHLASKQRPTPAV